MEGTLDIIDHRHLSTPEPAVRQDSVKVGGSVSRAWPAKTAETMIKAVDDGRSAVENTGGRRA
jgi:hypothetical protein